MSEEKKIDALPATDSSRWTEMELLPAWGEEFYDVYTGKKFGKWVMLKTLKPEFRDVPEYREMIDREFETRYNLAHPNIVMINDYEEIPGIGRCIITDDVYGDSLRKLLDTGKLTDRHYEQLCTRLPMAMEYIQQNHVAHHPIRPETIIFTENIGNLKLIDVGFCQQDRLSHEETSNDIRSYGEIMSEVLEKTGRRDAHMAAVAQKARRGGYNDVQALQMDISGHSNRRMIVIIVFVLAALAAALAWFTSHTTAPV